MSPDPAGATAPFDYRLEFADELAARGDFPRCFAFALHKSGSSLMHSMIGRVCDECGIPALNLPSRMFLRGRAGDWQDDPGVLDVIEDGRVYHGFRFLPDALRDPSARVRESRSVLLVRDPRDALVSLYFSVGGRYFSHALPEQNAEAFRARAEATRHMDIDEFVLLKAPQLAKRMAAYRDFLDFERVLLRRYEQIFYDKRSFLAEIFAHFGLAPAAGVLDVVALENDVRPDTEDPTRHIRKGTPGDHREKLRPETIARLDAMFGDIAASFGYAL